MLAKVNLFLYLLLVRMSGSPSLHARGVYGTFGSSILGLPAFKLLSLGDPFMTMESRMTNGNCLGLISSRGETLTCRSRFGGLGWVLKIILVSKALIF